MASFLDTYNKMSSAPMYSLEGSDKDEMLGAFRKMAQGASLESSDEIEASLRSIFGDKTYKENYDEIHENLDMFEEKYPVADNMSYLTGMASTAAVGFTPKITILPSETANRPELIAECNAVVLGIILSDGEIKIILLGSSMIALRHTAKIAGPVFLGSGSTKMVAGLISISSS